MNTSTAASAKSRRAERNHDARHGFPRLCAEVRGRLQQIVIQAFQRRKQRQDDERQIAVHQAQEHGAIVVQQRKWLADGANSRSMRS